MFCLWLICANGLRKKGPQRKTKDLGNELAHPTKVRMQLMVLVVFCVIVIVIVKIRAM